MIYALSKDNKRLYAKNSGEKATCQFCKSNLISTKTNSNIYYWHHNFGYKNCDSWYKPITEWRHEWLTLFPESWQEVIIRKNGTNHISDIKLPNKVILKFQDSETTIKLLKEQEEFFEDLIWIFNCEVLGIFDIKIITKKVLEQSPYLQVNPFTRIKTKNLWSLKKLLLNHRKPLFLDLNHKILFIKNIIHDTGNLNIVNEKFNFIKVYSEKEVYANIILETKILSKEAFLNKYYYSKL